MTLSKYERRVLEEFEAELKASSRRRAVTGRIRSTVVRVGALLRSHYPTLLWLLCGTGFCAAVIVLVAPPAAAIVTAIAGVVTGWAATRWWRRPSPPAG